MRVPGQDPRATSQHPHATPPGAAPEAEAPVSVPEAASGALSRPLRPAQVLALQRTLGNGAVQRLLFGAQGPRRAPSAVQRVFAVKTGAEAGGAHARFVALFNQILGGHSRLVVNQGQDGITLALETLDNGVQIPGDAAVLLETVQKVVEAAGTITLDFTAGDLSTYIGSFDDSSIDLPDVEHFGVGVVGPSAASALVHEIEEQYQKQANGLEFNDAHYDHAVAAENRAVGGTRMGHRVYDEVPDPEGNAHLRRYREDIKYTLGDGRVVVLTQRKQGQKIQGVERHVYENQAAYAASPRFHEELEEEEARPEEPGSDLDDDDDYEDDDQDQDDDDEAPGGGGGSGSDDGSGEDEDDDGGGGGLEDDDEHAGSGSDDDDAPEAAVDDGAAEVAAAQARADRLKVERERAVRYGERTRVVHIDRVLFDLWVEHGVD